MEKFTHSFLRDVLFCRNKEYLVNISKTQYIYKDRKEMLSDVLIYSFKLLTNNATSIHYFTNIFNLKLKLSELDINFIKILYLYLVHPEKYFIEFVYKTLNGKEIQYLIYLIIKSINYRIYSNSNTIFNTYDNILYKGSTLFLKDYCLILVNNNNNNNNNKFSLVYIPMNFNITSNKNNVIIQLTHK